MLLQEGLLYWRKRSHKSELVTAFLLSDLVILAHDKGRGRYEYRSSVALDNCSLLVLGNSKGMYLSRSTLHAPTRVANQT